MAKKPAGAIEIIDDTPVVETVAESKDFHQLASDEAFMNELVTVLVHSTTDENQSPHVILNCNGVNQPMIRGTPQLIKRKYLEILARMKETKYSQRTINPAVPDQIEMVARHGYAYPFEVIDDKNSRGRAWLSNIMAEPA